MRAPLPARPQSLSLGLCVCVPQNLHSRMPPARRPSRKAWLRGRGEPGGAALFDAAAVADRFGVAKGTYDATPTLPRRAGGGAAPAAALGVVCRRPGPVGRALALDSQVRRASSKMPCTAQRRAARPGARGAGTCSSAPRHPPTLPLPHLSATTPCARPRAQPLPAALEYGEVLLIMLAAPVGGYRN